MRKYTGIIIEDQKAVRKSTFKCFGEMADGMKCYHELDPEGEEIEGKWYSMARKKIDGTTYTLFFLEGLE